MNEGAHKSRVAIVTGSARGIGRAVAEQLADQGVTVVVSDRDATLGEEVAQAVSGWFVPSDLSDSDACERLVHEIAGRYGRIDILINNAGVQHVSPISEFPVEQWKMIVDLMLTAPFVLTKGVWPYMKKQGWGRIVNVASIHGLVASPCKSAYVSAKHGLLGLTKTAALEGGADGITVNAVCPAYVKTPLVENQVAVQAQRLQISAEKVEKEVFLKSAAVKRMIDPAEVAELVCYLCSEKASAVTGASLAIDLGWTAQ